MKSNAYIYTEHLEKSFQVGTGEVKVLKDVSLEIEKGEFVIIFGPSGCGKSTLLHTLLGLEVPTKGAVWMDGINYYGLTEDERAIFRRDKVGMIYQQSLWIGSFNVIENVSFPLHLLGMTESEILERAHKNLQMVGLDEWAEYRPMELSSGQQQKISLARSLMTDPQLIVADEPTGNLDTVSGQELIKTFIDLVNKGKTIIMVTHDLEYLKYATKIFHMVDGVIVEQYSAQDKKKLKALQSQKINGKKEISNSANDSNVRDPNFLKNLNL